jgi:hypothetical protein
MAISSLIALNECMSEPLTLVNLRALLLLLVKAHYSDADNFGLFSEELRCLVYNPDIEDNPITIGLDFIPVPKKPSPKPAIWVNMELCEFIKKVMDNRSGFSADNSRIKYNTLQHVVFSLTHVHDSVDICFMMAETTADFFTGMRLPLMEKMNIGMLEVTKISKPRIPEKAPDRHFEIDVTLDMQFNYAMTANIESHRLKKFVLDINAE